MSTTADLLFSIALFAVVIAVPFVSRRDQRRLERRLREDPHGARARSFAWGIVAQWLVAGLLLVGFAFTTLDPASVYLVPGWEGSQWAAVAVGVAICVAMVAQTILLRRRPESLAALRGQLGAAATIVPRTPREQRLFDVLSASAGVCEEIVYRGLALGTLAVLIGLWPAVVVSTVSFGLAHVYQGRAGAFRTGLFGAVAALLTVWSGSIVVAVVVHAIVNLSQSRLAASALAAAD